MKTEVIKAISKKIIINLSVLLFILILVIAITGIPTDFNIVTINGKSSADRKYKRKFQDIYYR